MIEGKPHFRDFHGSAKDFLHDADTNELLVVLSASTLWSRPWARSLEKPENRTKEAVGRLRRAAFDRMRSHPSFGGELSGLVMRYGMGKL